MNIRIMLSLSFFVLGTIDSGICQNNRDTLAEIENSQVITDSIFSTSLDSQRQLAIYFPAGFSSTQKYPVVFCTDGQLVVDD